MRTHDHDSEESTLRPKSARVETHPTAQLMKAAATGRSDVLDSSSILGLQRAVGNSGVGAMLEEERSPVHDVINSGGSPLAPWAGLGWALVRTWRRLRSRRRWRDASRDGGVGDVEEVGDLLDPGVVEVGAWLVVDQFSRGEECGGRSHPLLRPHARGSRGGEGDGVLRGVGGLVLGVAVVAAVFGEDLAVRPRRRLHADGHAARLGRRLSGAALSTLSAGGRGGGHPRRTCLRPLPGAPDVGF